MFLNKYVLCNFPTQHKLQIKPLFALEADSFRLVVYEGKVCN